jgi:hypothetical protein
MAQGLRSWFLLVCMVLAEDTVDMVQTKLSENTPREEIDEIIVAVVGRVWEGPPAGKKQPAALVAKTATGALADGRSGDAGRLGLSADPTSLAGSIVSQEAVRDADAEAYNIELVAEREERIGELLVALTRFEDGAGELPTTSETVQGLIDSLPDLPAPISNGQQIPCQVREDERCKKQAADPLGQTACFVGGAKDEGKSCGEPVHGCPASKVGDLSVLITNTHYRVGDIVFLKGLNWRSSAMAILSNPIFRGSMMRSVLRERVTVNGSSLGDKCKGDSAQADTCLESLLASLSEAGTGYFCNLGAKGPTGLTMPSSESMLQGMREWLQKRHGQGKCEVAEDNELVVPVRLGDKLDKPANVRREIDDALISKLKDANISTIVFTGVMHFSGFIGGFDGRATESKVDENFRFVNGLQDHYAEKGMTVRMRSESVADEDLCYLAFAPHLLKACRGGWCDIVNDVHSHAQR